MYVDGDDHNDVLYRQEVFLAKLEEVERGKYLHVKMAGSNVDVGLQPRQIHEHVDLFEWGKVKVISPGKPRGRPMAN